MIEILTELGMATNYQPNMVQLSELAKHMGFPVRNAEEWFKTQWAIHSPRLVFQILLFHIGDVRYPIVMIYSSLGVTDAGVLGSGRTAFVIFSKSSPGLGSRKGVLFSR